MQGGTNLLKVRDFNQQVVLETIRGTSGVSRTELAHETGLTAQTISNIVRRLLEEGLVVEAGKKSSARGGKPKVNLEINPDAGYALGAQIDRDEIALVLLNLGGQPLRRIRHAVPASQTPEEVVRLLAKSAEELMQEAGGVGHKMLGLGVASPGPLDPKMVCSTSLRASRTGKRCQSNRCCRSARDIRCSWIMTPWLPLSGSGGWARLAAQITSPSSTADGDSALVCS